MNANSQDASPPEQPEEALDQALMEAVNAAELLLGYAAEHGCDIDEGLTEAIVRSKHTMTTRALHEKEESAFWSAYRDLCIATAPVSRESIDATTDQPRRTLLGKKKDFSMAGKAVRYYQGVTIIAILVLLVFQIYWVFVSTLVNDSRRLRSELIDHEVLALTKEAELKNLKDSFEIDFGYRLWEKEIQKAARDDVVMTDEEAKAIERLRKLNAEVDIMYESPRIRNLRDQLDANLELLRRVDVVGKLFVDPMDPMDPYGVKYDEGATMQLQTAPISLQIMSLYLLPILYGLVGACAYILRTISREIKARTFTSALKIRLQLRMVLGALAGFSIAWFVGGENETSIVGNVAPLALAFLAGYSVELLFSAMDTLVEAFTRQRRSE